MIGPMYVKKRLVKNGPYVGIRICRDYMTDPVTGEKLIERGERWLVEVNAEGVCWTEVIETFDPISGNPVMWGASVPIDEAEYRYFCEAAKWAAKYDPNAPEANPSKPIDFLKIAPLF